MEKSGKANTRASALSHKYASLAAFMVLKEWQLFKWMTDMNAKLQIGGGNISYMQFQSLTNLDL